MKSLKLLLIICFLYGCSPSDRVANTEVKNNPLQSDPLAAPEMKQNAPHAVELGWKYFNEGDLDTAMRRFQMAVRHDKTYAPGY